MTDDRTILRSLFDAAVEAANPVKAVVRNLPPKPEGRTAVIAAGKAAVPMAKAVEDNWDGPLEGLVIAPHGYGHDLKRLRLVHGSHPVPDKTSLAAAEQALALAATLGPDDLLIALISGGASALMSKPVPGISIEEKFGLVKAVLRCGANIAELNCVRKQVSAVKGGRLARAAGKAAIWTLALSDVPGDDPSIIGSGPTVPDPTRKRDALAILARYGVPVPQSVEAWLKAPDEDRSILSGHTETRVIVSPHESFRAVRAKSEGQGLNVLYLGDRIEGEAREVAKVHAAIALEIAGRDAPAKKPCLLLSGGETGVTVRGKGRGGRNVEFLLALAIALGGGTRITALAADTDGIDGMEQIAGAVIDPLSLDRARALGLDPMASLENNDAHTLFERLGDQVITGPTHTNVNDFRGILIR
ncbi:MAG: glycerate kinase [Aestuariivirga sp.]|uniref:glycerate kinase type-2 family protein n=1 Tax=Aestuariivirga sp. TaxID=2650926 RepID=UPI0025BDD1DA|nr:glycerate kinase [Aestuariivirga sp.]MCA3562299.1 glycerate kinase [Aestuariivirga sp.]